MILKNTIVIIFFVFLYFRRREIRIDEITNERLRPKSFKDKATAGAKCSAYVGGILMFLLMAYGDIF